MKKQILYTYLGTNGTITSPVFLEGIYSVKKITLRADSGYVLTNDGGKTTRDSVTVPESEVSAWQEIKNPWTK